VRVELAETARALALISVAAALLAAASYGVWRGLDDLVGRSLGGQIVSLGLALGVGLAVFVGAARLVGVRELQAVLSLRRRRP